MSQAKVLIVEDDADTRSALNLRLRVNHYDTVCAADGFSAMSAAARERPDVILLDLGLPAGDGFTVMKHLQSNAALSAIPVIVLTGREREGNYDRAVEAGCYAYFQKPPQADALLMAIGAAVGTAMPRRLEGNKAGEAQPGWFPRLQERAVFSAESVGGGSSWRAASDGSAPEPAGRRPKILIVEDDSDTRRALNLRLRVSNYDTVYAVDGFSAVCAAAKERPDLILLDLGLPAGDGFTVIERLQANPSLATIPVIVLTGRDRKVNFERAMRAGCYAYFQKPPDSHALLTAIDSAIGSGTRQETATPLPQ